MSINIVVKSEAPEPPYNAHLSAINIQFIPFVEYGIWLKSQRYFWSSADDWRVARSALAEQGAAILLDGTLPIVNAIDRLYTLIDVRTAGNVRDVTGTGTDIDPFVYDPPIPQSAAYMDGQEGSLLNYSAINLSAWQNLLNGEHSSDWGDSYHLKVQLQELIDQDAGDDTDMATLLAFAEASGISLESLLLLLA